MNEWLTRKLRNEFMDSMRGWCCCDFLGCYPDKVEFWKLPTRTVFYWRVYAGNPPRLMCRGEWSSYAMAQAGVSAVAKAVKSILERVQLARAGVQLGMGSAGPADLASFPSLSEMMTSAMYPGGEVREVSRLSVYADQENGGWRSMLTEPSQALVLWTHSDTLGGILQATEEHVSSDKPDWRYDRYAAKRGAKKGKA